MGTSEPEVNSALRPVAAT